MKAKDKKYQTKGYPTKGRTIIFGRGNFGSMFSNYVPERQTQYSPIREMKDMSSEEIEKIKNTILKRDRR